MQGACVRVGLWPQEMPEDLPEGCSVIRAGG
jgi:hypothetical protein